MKKTLYILCGLSFAGKTTLAKVLEHHFGFVRICMDSINTERGVGQDGEVISPEEWERTDSECDRQIEEWLQVGRSVIFDSPGFLKVRRDHLRAIATRCNADTLVIYLAVPEAEARQRWLQNRITHERYDVRDEDFEHVVTYLEPPTQEEQFVAYHPSQPVEEWIQHIFLKRVED